MKHYLVVADRTFGGEALRAAILARVEAGTCHFHVLVPADWPEDRPGGTRAEPPAPPGSARVAGRQLAAELDRLRTLEVSASGEVVDPDLVDAVGQALAERRIDEILLATSSAGVAGWFALDLASRVERATEVPVVTVSEDDDAPESGGDSALEDGDKASEGGDGG